MQPGKLKAELRRIAAYSTSLVTTGSQEYPVPGPRPFPLVAHRPDALLHIVYPSSSLHAILSTFVDIL